MKRKKCASSLVGFGSQMFSRLSFLELNEGFGGYGEKNGFDSCWEFPLKFADRTAFPQQHMNFLLLVGTAGVKSSVQYRERRSRKVE